MYFWLVGGFFLWGLLKVVYKKCQFVVLKNSCVLLLKVERGWLLEVGIIRICVLSG